MKNNTLTKTTAALAISAGLLASIPTTANASTKTSHATVARGIITAPTCNAHKTPYPNPGFNMKKAEIFTGTQYSTLKMTFDKNISLQKLKTSKYYKDGASTSLELNVTMDNKQWGSLYYNVRTNKANVYTWGNTDPTKNYYDQSVYSNVTFSGNIMRITFPRKPLNITNKTQYHTDLTYDYYAGQPAGIDTPYYTTECQTNQYPY